MNTRWSIACRTLHHDRCFVGPRFIGFWNCDCSCHDETTTGEKATKMATIYCLCGQKNLNRADQFRERNNSFRERTESVEFSDCLDKAVVILDEHARCVKTGATQVTAAGAPAYPNVDIYRCLSCGREFAFEGWTN